MNSKIKSLIKNFKKKIDSLRKDIFSVVVHGSSVYSEELKPHQDIDIYFILKRKDIRVYRKIKKILNDFCKENSKGDIFTYYSIAGAGNVQVEKNLQKKKQVYRLEIFFSDEKNFKICWKENSSFPKSLCKNYKILIGEDIKKYLPFVGSQENLIEIYDGFDKLQWNYVSIIESDFNSKVIYSSVQEGIFYDLGLFFSS